MKNLCIHDMRGDPRFQRLYLADCDEANEATKRFVPSKQAKLVKLGRRMEG